METLESIRNRYRSMRAVIRRSNQAKVNRGISGHVEVGYNASMNSCARNLENGHIGISFARHVDYKPRLGKSAIDLQHSQSNGQSSVPVIGEVDRMRGINLQAINRMKSNIRLPPASGSISSSASLKIMNPSSVCRPASEGNTIRLASPPRPVSIDEETLGRATYLARPHGCP